MSSLLCCRGSIKRDCGGSGVATISEGQTPHSLDMCWGGLVQEVRALVKESMETMFSLCPATHWTSKMNKLMTL